MAADLNNRAVIFETDASNNTATDPGWPEGMAPSRVNDAARALQGAIARDWDRRGPTVTSGGSANAQTLTYTVAQTALVQGDSYAFIAGFTNTGATTLAVSGLTAKAVRLGNAALTGGEIVAGLTYVVMYDGTAYQMINMTRGGLIGVQVFTTAGTATYTPTAGTNSVVVECIGGGGGGGGAAATAGGQVSGGSGGSGGGYARKRLTTGFSGASYTVGAKGTGGTAGANNGTDGAASTFGTGPLVSAAGGGKGFGGSAATPPTISNGPSAPAIGTIGDVLASSQQGGIGFLLSSSLVSTAPGGGAAVYVGGSGNTVTTTGSAGAAAKSFGGGGEGAANAASQSARAGGDGKDGAVIVWEYN